MVREMKPKGSWIYLHKQENSSEVKVMKNNYPRRRLIAKNKCKVYFLIQIINSVFIYSYYLYAFLRYVTFWFFCRDNFD